MDDWVERGLLHPDLAEVGRRLQARLDRVLDAEREAALVLARRGATLRDRLLDAEDACAEASLTVIGGLTHRGRVRAVTVDHVEVQTLHGRAFIPLDALLVVWVH